MPSFLSFVFKTVSPSGKTKVWSVVSTTGSALGEVRWYSQWRKYAFFPKPDTLFDPDCLFDIGHFCRRETELHKG